MLFLEMPKNHLDIIAIHMLIDAIKEFKSVMMLASHDFRLIQQVTQET
jgi:ATPase subunit of ABC transporter with duplicated ATPase domains